MRSIENVIGLPGCARNEDGTMTKDGQTHTLFAPPWNETAAWMLAPHGLGSLVSPETFTALQGGSNNAGLFDYGGNTYELVEQAPFAVHVEQ